MSKFRIFGKSLEVIGIVLMIVILGALLIGLTVNAIYVAMTGSNVRNQLDKIAAAGDPVTLADLAHKPIPPGENAVVYLRRAKSDIEAVEKTLMQIYNSPEYEQGQFTPEQLKFIESTLAAHPNLFPLLEQAAQAPDYDSQLDFTKDFQTMLDGSLKNDAAYKRPSARILNYRARILLTQGDTDKALDSCLAIFRLSRLFALDPTLVNNQISSAVRGLAIEATNRVLRSGSISDESRAALDEELALHDDWASYEWCLRSERVFGIAHFDESIPWRKHWLTRGLGNSELGRYLELMQQEIDNVGRLPKDVQELDLTNSRSLATMIMASIQASRDVQLRSIAAVRTLRTLNALQRSSGKTDLADLKLPKDSTIDPYTGDPLIVKESEAGPIIYSVGKNLKDDGGNIVDNIEDVGVGPIELSANRTDNSDK